MWLTLVAQRTFAKGLIHSFKHTASTYYMESTWQSQGRSEIPIGHPPHHQGAHRPVYPPLQPAHWDKYSTDALEQIRRVQSVSEADTNWKDIENKCTGYLRTCKVLSHHSHFSGKEEIQQIHKQSQKRNQCFHILIKMPVISFVWVPISQLH